MSDGEILTTIEEGVARIVFNRPKARNALTAEMLTRMTDFLEKIEHDTNVRVVVLTGAGEHFMAGGDVAGFDDALEAGPSEREQDFARRARSGVPVFSLMERIPQPIVARVRGAVAGASIGWVAAADYAIASETALFAFAHIHLGASPDGGLTWHLPRVVGVRRAKELIMFGGRLDAAGALAAGLLNKVVADADLDAETDKIVQRFAVAPSYAIGRTKALINHAAERSQDEQMELEAQSFGACAATADFVEGVRAFTGKRKAVFQGR